MIETPALMSAALALVLQFCDTVNVPPQWIPRGTNEITLFLPMETRRGLLIYMECASGSHFTINKGIVGFRGPDTDFTTKDPEIRRPDLAMLAGEPRLGTNQVIALASNTVARLVRRGKPLAKPSTMNSVASYQGRALPIYDVRWGMKSDYAYDISVQVDARDGSIRALHVFTEDFRDFDSDAKLAALVPKPSPSLRKPARDTLQGRRERPAAETNVIKGIALTMVERFCEAAKIPTRYVPRSTSEFVRCAIVNPENFVSVYLTCSNGAEFAIHAGVVAGFRTPNSYFDTVDRGTAPDLAEMAGDTRVSTNQMIAIASTAVGRLVRQGNPLQAPPTVESAGNYQGHPLPIYRVRWGPPMEIDTIASVEVDGRDGSIRDLHLYDQGFHDLDSARTLAALVPDSSPAAIHARLVPARLQTGMDTNTLRSLALDMIGRFCEVAKISDQYRPRTTNDFFYFFPSVLNADVVLQVVCFNGAKFRIIRGIVSGFQTPKSYFNLQEPRFMHRWVGESKLTTNEVMTLAGNTLTRLVRRGRPIQDRPALELPGNYHGQPIPFYNVRWGPPIGAVASVEVDANDGSITALNLYSDAFFDPEFAETLAARVIRPPPKPFLPPKRPLASDQPHPTTNEVAQAIANWLKVCQVLEINPGGQSNLANVDWERTRFWPEGQVWNSAPGHSSFSIRNVCEVCMHNGTVFSSIDGRIFRFGAWDEYCAEGYQWVGWANLQQFFGKIAWRREDLAGRFQQALTGKFGIPAGLFERYPATMPWPGLPAYGKDDKEWARGLVLWCDAKKEMEEVKRAGVGGLGNGLTAEFDLSTGQVKSFRFEAEDLATAFMKGQETLDADAK